MPDDGGVSVPVDRRRSPVDGGDPAELGDSEVGPAERGDTDHAEDDDREGVLAGEICGHRPENSCPDGGEAAGAIPGAVSASARDVRGDASAVGMGAIDVRGRWWWWRSRLGPGIHPEGWDLRATPHPQSLILG